MYRTKRNTIPAIRMCSKRTNIYNRFNCNIFFYLLNLVHIWSCIKGKQKQAINRSRQLLDNNNSSFNINNIVDIHRNPAILVGMV